MITLGFYLDVFASPEDNNDADYACPTLKPINILNG
ncbi:hypothetical protein NPIRD3C_0306 [Nitrosopumilus piranensis]|uniref:Uncharacterized protein n=1 Tax=Nitrosopumilus piranensis TaxID=1582439 RepID=A0A0C5BTM7_9ARCH|nr:hypothetical protein NPIRD3C_0306 [Nitrosopumilus piranensis]